MMYWYLTFKNIHILCVILTLLLFSVRGVWMIQQSAWLQQRWIKIIPHLIDTLLLASGIGLVMIIHQYPGSQNWLTAKLVALLVYIVAGHIALKRGHTLKIRVLALLGALGVFFYIVMVALTRIVNPLAWELP